MGEALFDLERVLASNKPTIHEARILVATKKKALRDLTVGACVGYGVAWAATTRLFTWRNRIFLSGGAAAYLGLWRFSNSLNKSVDHILALEGSRMQRELANILAKKYQDYPGVMQLLSKHFYSESVFDDSTYEKPKIQWRYRNFFSDNSTYDPRTSEDATENENDQPSCNCGSQGNSQNKPLNSKGDSPSGYDTKETKLEVKSSPINLGVDLIGDPLDFVFGYSTPREEIQHPTNTAASPNAQVSRRHRSSRRRRRHHQEVPLDS